GGAGLPADYAFRDAEAGRPAFSVTLFRAGSQTVTLTDVGNADLIDTVSVLVHAASVAYFDVTAAGPVYAGEPFDLTVTARDAYGNLVTDYQGTVSLRSFLVRTDLPADYTFTADDARSHPFRVTAQQQGLLLLLV